MRSETAAIRAAAAIAAAAFEQGRAPYQAGHYRERAGGHPRPGDAQARGQESALRRSWPSGPTPPGPTISPRRGNSAEGHGPDRLRGPVSRATAATSPAPSPSARPRPPTARAYRSWRRHKPPRSRAAKSGRRVGGGRCRRQDRDSRERPARLRPRHRPRLRPGNPRDPLPQGGRQRHAAGRPDHHHRARRLPPRQARRPHRGRHPHHGDGCEILTASCPRMPTLQR